MPCVWVSLDGFAVTTGQPGSLRRRVPSLPSCGCLSAKPCCSDQAVKFLFLQLKVLTDTKASLLNPANQYLALKPEHVCPIFCASAVFCLGLHETALCSQHSDNCGRSEREAVSDQTEGLAPSRRPERWKEGLPKSSSLLS